MKHKNHIGILHITDIHLGLDKNKAKDITGNLVKIILDNDKDIRANIDLIALGGDEFEDLLSVNSEDFIEAKIFFIFLAKYAAKNNIKIRCIEGTNSHSYKQMKTLESTFLAEDKLDFKYIETVDIEYIPDLDINVLYVPDEQNGNIASETIKQVRALMKAKNLDFVDIAITHGAFNYNLPMVKLKSSHVESDYLDIVKHFIYNGHIHTFSIYDRIITTGSADRLRHNEEEDKGILYSIINLKDRKKDFYKLIVNTTAKIFKTIKVETDVLDELKEILIKELKRIPRYSYIRLHVEEGNTIVKHMHEIKKKFPYYIFTEEKISKDKITVVSNKLLEKKPVESISITKDNIVGLIFKSISDKNLGEKITGEDMAILERELKLLV